MNQITLTADQEKVKNAFTQFILDPDQRTMVITGYAGTGKSTLTGILIDELPKLLQTAKLLSGPNDTPWSVDLTATTNKAAEALSHLTGAYVCTIQSFLGLRVDVNYQTRQTKLVPTKRCHDIHDTILFIDEASYIDDILLGWITKLTENCKVIFMGDPAQLTPVKSSVTPVFHQGYHTVGLEQVVRQTEDHPIIDLATAFRNTVNTGEFFSFTPDNINIVHMDRETFDQAALKDFSDPNWKNSHSKLLAWTNKRVIAYNHAINDLVKGTPNLQVDDYAVCNKYISNRECSLRTDQLVRITGIHPDTAYGVQGWKVEMDNRHRAFLPARLEDKTKALKDARQQEDWAKVQTITDFWIDLRAAYACTINKSQGSTYDRVYIDLDDISKCNNANTIARMLYVAVSRARYQVFLTGDLV